MGNWIVGISDSKPHEYKIGNVTFRVLSVFEPTNTKTTIKNRFERTLKNDFVDLTSKIGKCKIANEYVCSAAGKEA